MKPNILFFLIDTFRADKFFGCEKTSVTPNIDKLIKNGTYFSQAIGSSDGTILSLSGLFTGLHPFKTGIMAPNYKKIDPNTKTFFSILKTQGYHFYGNLPKINESLGIFPKWENKDYAYDYYWNLSEGLGEKIIELLESKKMTSPWFYYIHIEDLHFPIVLEKKFSDDKFGTSKYEKKVSAIDEWIGKIIEKIDSNNTLVIFTADHGHYIKAVSNNNLNINLEVNGETQTLVRNIGNKIPKKIHPVTLKLFLLLEKIRKKRKNQKIKNLELTNYEKRALLWQRSDLEHFLFDEIVKIPLLFYGYNIKKNLKISEQVRLIDIFPTIFDIIQIKNDFQSIDGQSLMPLIEGEIIKEQPAVIETHYSIELKSLDKIGIRTSNYKYFRDKDDPTQRIHLYNLKNDPHENYNIANNNSEIVNKMENLLQEILHKSSEIKNNEFTEEETKMIEDELKKLGYV